MIFCPLGEPYFFSVLSFLPDPFSYSFLGFFGFFPTFPFSFRHVIYAFYS